MKFGWTISSHSYSQTWLPRITSDSDHYFPHFQRHLDCQDFQIRNDINEALEQILKDHSPAFCSKGIYDLPIRWQKTINANDHRWGMLQMIHIYRLKPASSLLHHQKRTNSLKQKEITRRRIIAKKKDM
ncbi:hypothetical protein ANCDUO_17311 [Ancylostoma duodenale]|uniref:Uncharacterized protein n=1 Tax=Ancylostoma duodenale TaxID=51022 RepID=A0A0C2G678_9BILA|nr:hypothetical protein ANCDUO_17311 [Ancylostoma duodenale]